MAAWAADGSEHGAGSGMNKRLGQVNAAGRPYAAPVKAESSAVCCRGLPHLIFIK